MEKMLACAAAALSTGAMPLALQLASASCTELTLVSTWGDGDPHHQHDVRLCSGMALLPPRWKYSVPFLILIYQTACPFGQEIVKKLASPKHPFAREPEQGRC